MGIVIQKGCHRMRPLEWGWPWTLDCPGMRNSCNFRQGSFSAARGWARELLHSKFRRHPLPPLTCTPLAQNCVSVGHNEINRLDFPCFRLLPGRCLGLLPEREKGQGTFKTTKPWCCWRRLQGALPMHKGRGASAWLLTACLFAHLPTHLPAYLPLAGTAQMFLPIHSTAATWYSGGCGLVVGRGIHLMVISALSCPPRPFALLAAGCHGWGILAALGCKWGGMSV